MRYMKTNKNINECFDILERSIIESSIFNIGALGYVGKVDRLFREFWIVDHMNLYRKRNGLKFSSYRRFEGNVYSISDGTSIEGEFKLIPMYKFVGIFYMMLLLLITLFVAVFSGNLIATIKVLLLTSGFACVGVLIFYFNISRAKKYEEEVIEFIDGLLNKDNA